MYVNAVKKDIVDTAKMVRYLWASAYLRLKIQYRSSVLSFFWEPLTVFFVASVLTTIWSLILEVADVKMYFSYILVGFALWNLLFSKLVSRAVLGLSKKSGDLVTQIRPVSSIPVEEILFCFTGFFLALPFILAVTVYLFGFQIGSLIYFLYGLFLVFIVSFSLSFTLGVVAFFIRDIEQVVVAVMRISFLITPIIWYPSRLGEYADLIWWNPFYSFLDICRSPLLGEAPAQKSMLVATSIAGCLFVLAIITLALSKDSIRRRAFR